MGNVSDSAPAAQPRLARVGNFVFFRALFLFWFYSFRLIEIRRRCRFRLPTPKVETRPVHNLPLAAKGVSRHEPQRGGGARVEGRGAKHPRGEARERRTARTCPCRQGTSGASHGLRSGRTGVGGEGRARLFCFCGKNKTLVLTFLRGSRRDCGGPGRSGRPITRSRGEVRSLSPKKERRPAFESFCRRQRKRGKRQSTFFRREGKRGEGGGGDGGPPLVVVLLPPARSRL